MNSHSFSSYYYWPLCVTVTVLPRPSCYLVTKFQLGMAAFLGFLPKFTFQFAFLSSSPCLPARLVFQLAFFPQIDITWSEGHWGRLPPVDNTRPLVSSLNLSLSSRIRVKSHFTAVYYSLYRGYRPPFRAIDLLQRRSFKLTRDYYSNCPGFATGDKEYCLVGSSRWKSLSHSR